MDRKTNLTFAGLLVCLLLPSASFGLEVGAPGRDLELGKTSLSGGFSYTSFEIDQADCSSRAFGGKFAFGVARGVTPYLRLGFGDLSTPAGDGSLGFAWGGGVLLGLMAPASPDGLALLADLQAVRTETKISDVSSPFTQVQGALLGSLKSGGTTSYGGFALSSLAVRGAERQTKSHLFFGLDYFIDFSFYVNAEVHLFGEDTLAVGVGYLF